MQDVSKVTKELDKLMTGSFSSYQIFNDWIDLMLYALQRDDEHYLEIVRKYKNDKPQGQREIDHFKTAFHILMEVMRESNREILGEVYMQWNMGNKYKGQFFTPHHIAEMMSAITKPKGKIYDPTCGAGVMLISAAKNMSYEDCNISLFIGQDLDTLCVKMTAINLCFFNLNGYAIQGNTLLMECNKVYKTTRSVYGGSIRELSDVEVKIFSSTHQEAIKQTPTAGQLSIF